MSHTQINKGKTLLESIKVLDNKIYNLEAHRQRMLASYSDIFEEELVFDFQSLQRQVVAIPSGLHKLRLLYGKDKMELEFHPYVLKPIHSLKLVFDDEIEYKNKSADREALHQLYKKKGNHDDIIIVRDGLLTDSYYCNVALLKDGTWYTPKDPLLRGTMRKKLLSESLIKEKSISLDSLFRYSKIRLFNAMIDFGEIEVNMGKVF